MLPIKKPLLKYWADNSLFSQVFSSPFDINVTGLQSITCRNVPIYSSMNRIHVTVSRWLPFRCSSLVPGSHGSESVHQQPPAHVVSSAELQFWIWQQSTDSPHPGSQSGCFHKLPSRITATSLPPATSPYPRLSCFGSEWHPVLQKNPLPLGALWRHVSLDFSNSLIVLDQYLQQLVSPVKSVSNLTQLMCAVINGGSKIWGRKTRFR